LGLGLDLGLDLGLGLGLGLRLRLGLDLGVGLGLGLGLGCKLVQNQNKTDKIKNQIAGTEPECTRHQSQILPTTLVLPGRKLGVLSIPVQGHDFQRCSPVLGLGILQTQTKHTHTQRHSKHT
jgi:hypothetical protein